MQAVDKVSEHMRFCLEEIAI